MSNPIAEVLAKELIKIYSQHKLPHYAELNAASAEGFIEQRIKSDLYNSLFQMIILAAYDRTPFTRWARGFEPIWGLRNPKESLPGILRAERLFTVSSVLGLEEQEIEGILSRCSFYGHHLASYGKIVYATTFKRTADLVSSLLSDIRAATTADDVERFHSNLDSIPGIGETIASKIVMYTLRELPYFGSSIHPRELYPAVKPILEEYHNAKLIKELKNCYGDSIVDEIFDVLRKLGDPFAIDAFYYIDRDEPKFKECLLQLPMDEPDSDDEEEGMSKDDDNKELKICLEPEEMRQLEEIAEKRGEDVRKVATWCMQECIRQLQREIIVRGEIIAPKPGEKYKTGTALGLERLEIAVGTAAIETLRLPYKEGNKKLKIGSDVYSAKLHYNEKTQGSWIGAPLNGGAVKLAEPLVANGFTSNEEIRLKFERDSIHVLKKE